MTGSVILPDHVRLTDTENGVHVHVRRHDRGWSVSVQDADSGETVQTWYVYPTRERALDAARKIAAGRGQ